jgi:hypothetical protein
VLLLLPAAFALLSAVYAIGADATGAPDGSNPGLSGSPRRFDVGALA